MKSIWNDLYPVALVTSQNDLAFCSANILLPFLSNKKPTKLKIYIFLKKKVVCQCTLSCSNVSGYLDNCVSDLSGDLEAVFSEELLSPRNRFMSYH